MSGIRLENVSKSFPGGILAINDLSMEINNKELLVLTGPSDCGKSTLLRLIAGLEDPCRGNIYIDGQLVNYIDPTERNIAMVFQNLNLYPHMTIFQNMEFGPKFRKLNIKQVRENIVNIAEMLEISHLLDKYPNELDAFERQRVAFARAAVKHPRVYLVDRVSTRCSDKEKKRLYEEITAIHQKLRATVVVAIDSDVAPVCMGDRTAVMNNGRIEQIGAYEELYNRPSNKFVAGFMGRGHTSFISARVCEEDENVYLNIGRNKIGLEPEKIKDLKEGQYINREVIIALRPEDISFDDRFQSGNAIEAKIETIEISKEESFLNLFAEGIHFCVKTSDYSKFKRGDSLRVAVDISKILLLDKDSGRAI